MPAYPKPPARRSRWNRPAFDQAPPRTGLWRLTFALPVIFSLLTKPGRHGPCLMGCLVTLGNRDAIGHAVDTAGMSALAGYFVVVDATSREGALEQAARFLRGLLRELRQVGNLPPATSIPAKMRGPIGETWCRTDRLNIVVGADVTFAEGGIEPYLPAREEEPAA